MNFILRHLLCAALASVGLTATAETASLFAYDRAAPLDVRETSREDGDGVVVRDINFAARDERVDAFLVSPKSSARGPAVLYVHWFGDPKTTNRTQFLDEAKVLARRGVTSLLVNTMWSKQGWWKNRRIETDLPQGAQQVIALRRALDLLLEQPGVDAARLAFVGHDFGAMYGAVMGAVDGRPKSYVLMAPTPRMSDWYLFTVKPESPDAYRAQLAPLDAIDAVARLNAPVFYQFASTDKYVPAPRPTQFYDATKPRKVMATYESDHDLLPPEVAADRVAWLERELKL